MENKHDVCRGKDCMKKFCQSLRKHGIMITNYRKKEMKLIIKNTRNHMKIQKYVLFEDKYAKDTREYRGATHIICKENPVVFHNRSHYGYHFIIKEPAGEFKG